MTKRFLDSFRSYTPWFLQNRPDKNVGYKMLWSMIMPIDRMVQALTEGLQAPWPGLGTPDALPAVARGRGILRGETESTTHFEGRLIDWLDTWQLAAGDVGLAQAIQQYLGNTPMVRVITRAGHWTTVASDGTVTTATGSWNWDGISNPERAGYWSDLWIVVYPTEWDRAVSYVSSQDPSHDGEGFGHLCSRSNVDAIQSLVATLKPAGTKIRALIWSYNPALFGPAGPVAGDPDGTWGDWMIMSGGQFGTATLGRPITDCRIWEPPFPRAHVDNPKNFPAHYDVIVDADLRCAGTYNPAIVGMSDATANVAERARSLAALNFPRGLAAWSGAQNVAGILIGPSLGAGVSAVPVWDAFNARWLSACDIGGSLYLLESFDGYSWVQSGGALPFGGVAACAITVRASDGAVVVLGAGRPSTLFATAFTATRGGSWTGGSFSTVGASAGAFYKGLWVLAGGGAPLWSKDGVHWTLGAIVPDPDLGSVLNAILVASPSILMLFPTVLNPGKKYASSTDGKTWISGFMPDINADERIVGAGYDPSSGYFFALASNDTASRLFRSTTGQGGSWTLVLPATFRAPSVPDSTTVIDVTQVKTIAHPSTALAVGRLEMIAWVQLPNSTYRGILSTDGGASWSLTPLAEANAPYAGSAYGEQSFGLASSGAQWLFLNQGVYSPSIVAGPAPALAS